MYRCPCRQSIFRSYNIHFQCCAFWWRSFHMPVWKRTHKGLRVSNVALLWVVFKWHHGSKGVKDQIAPTCNYMLQHLAACWKSQTQAAKQLLGHTKILHTLVGMGRVRVRVIWSLTPRAAAVPYPILHTLVGMDRVRVIWSLTPRAAAVPYPILHTLVGMGRVRVRVIWSLTPRAAAVPYPGNVTWISHKGQWRIKLGGDKI